MRVTIILSIIVEHCNLGIAAWKMIEGFSTFSVIAFFLFSGFLFKPSGSLLEWKRAGKILVVWLMACVFYYVLSSLLRFIPHGEWKSLPNMHTLGFWYDQLGLDFTKEYPRIGVFWFFRAFFLLTLFAPLMNRLPVWLLYCASAGFFAVHELGKFFPYDIFTHTIFTKNLNASAISFFMLGLAISKQVTAIQIEDFFMKRPLIPLLMMSLFVLMLLLQIIFPYPYFRYSRMYYITPLVISNHLALCWLCLRYAPRMTKWVSTFAASVFLVFIAHWPVMSFCREMAAVYHWSWMEFVLPFFIFFICLGFFFVLNRIPYLSEWLCYAPVKRISKGG